MIRPRKPYWRGLHISFLLVGGLMAACLLTSFFLDAQQLDSFWLAKAVAYLTHHPPEAKCLLCGMTHAFCSLSRGKIQEAILDNRLSLLAYPIFWIGALYGVVSLTRWLFRQLRHR